MKRMENKHAPWWVLLAIVCLVIIIWVTMDQWGRVREAGGRNTSPPAFDMDMDKWVIKWY